MNENKYNILSLFSNIGVSEAYMKVDGFNVVVANELIPRRAKIYSDIYPSTQMIIGDIKNEEIYSNIIESSKELNVNVVIATPPCQGMSTIGTMDEKDDRNQLTVKIINVVKDLEPAYVMIENVPNFINTTINYNSHDILLTDLIKQELSNKYKISINIINTEDYGIPQSRERMIILLSKNNISEWQIPEKETKKVTLMDAIASLPMIDPYVKDITQQERNKLFPFYEERRKRALEISEWNEPPVHVYRQVYAMMHTPTGTSAFDNIPEFRPKKIDGTYVKGYKNTYMRQKWDQPAYTVTMDNRKISSQGNVHPGRFIGKFKGHRIYSDPRVLTTYEIMKVMSIPPDWPIVKKRNDAYIRRVIGEGIPPLFIRKLFLNLPR